MSSTMAPDVNEFTNAVVTWSEIFPTISRPFPYPYGADVIELPLT